MLATPRRHSPSSNGNEARSAPRACARPAKRIFAMRTMILPLACAAAMSFALCGGGALAAEPDPRPDPPQQMFKGRPRPDGARPIAIDRPRPAGEDPDAPAPAPPA